MLRILEDQEQRIQQESNTKAEPVKIVLDIPKTKTKGVRNEPRTKITGPNGSEL